MPKGTVEEIKATFIVSNDLHITKDQSIIKITEENEPEFSHKVS